MFKFKPADVKRIVSSKAGKKAKGSVVIRLLSRISREYLYLGAFALAYVGICFWKKGVPRLTLWMVAQFAIGVLLLVFIIPFVFKYVKARFHKP